MTDPADWIWAYLHSELTPAEKELFEQTVQNNPSLRQEFDECQSTHRQLTDLLPDQNSVEISNKRLEAKLLAEWQAEHPEYAETRREKPCGNILRFTLPLAAVAAAVAILLALPSPSIHWQRTVYGSAPQLRGQTATPPHYTRTDLKQVSRELQDAINEASRQSQGWNLKISLQELADGALAVEVAGLPQCESGFPKVWKNEARCTAVSSRVWNKNFQGLENFRQNIPRFGKQIADDLAGQDKP